MHASAQFQGFGDGLTEDDPWGFFDIHAFIEFLKGPKYSLLYIWDSPTAFWIHMGAFQLCAVLFMIGFRTRLMGVSNGFNDNALDRGVVAHGAPYVTATKAGRSEGCPAMEPTRAQRLLPKLADGGMVFLFAPDENWMASDPWLASAGE